MLRDNKLEIAPRSSNFFSKPVISLNKMCIVFDIDDTLTSKVERDSDFDDHKSYLRFAKEQFPDHIIPITLFGTIYDHILSPGALEAVQYLLTSGCHLALYSHGIDERNQQFKIELLKRALSPADVKKYENRVKVFSREKHFITSRKELEPELEGTYGNQKKDLNFVLDAFAESGINFSIDQIILIDDDLSWMMKWQERNFLKVPGCYDHDITSSLSNLKENKINHLFYAIGLLSSILKSNKPLDTLYNLQFRDPRPGSWSKNKEYHHALTNEFQYYELGLEILQRVNKDLQLIDPKYIQQISTSKKIRLDESSLSMRP